MKKGYGKILALCMAAFVAFSAEGVPQKPRENGFAIMSFNVRHCSGMDGKLDIPRTAAAISAHKPRLVALQEVDVNVKRSKKVDQAAELGRLTGLYHTFGDAIDLQGGKYGVAILSKEKPLSVSKIPLPGLEPRVFLLAEFDDCYCGVSHFDYRSETNRRKSVRLIREFVEKAVKTKPVFICGDWNAGNDSATLDEVRKSFCVLSDVSKGTFNGSENKDAPTYCIDYIAVDAGHAKDWEVLHRETVQDETTSDHKPVVVKIGKK